MYAGIDGTGLDTNMQFQILKTKPWRPTFLSVAIAQVLYPVPAATTDPYHARLTMFEGTAPTTALVTPTGDNIVLIGGVISKRHVDLIVQPNVPFEIDLSQSGIVIDGGVALTVLLGPLVLRDGTITANATVGCLSFRGLSNDDSQGYNVKFR